MARIPALAFLALSVLSACGSKKKEPAADPPTGSAAATTTTATGPADAAPPTPVARKDEAPAPPPTITKEARATYRKQLEAGRKLAKATRWAEAITAFEAALAAVPGDDRALSELSFAAMNAGDAQKARDAGRRAVLATTEPKVKAAALYNLGRVEETHTPSLAASLYRQSLALRPNKTVEKRLAELEKAVPAAAAAEELPCATPMPRAKLCECLGETTELAPDERRCEVMDAGGSGLAHATYATSSMGEEEVVLVAGSGDRWQVIGRLLSIYNPGAFGISEEWEMDGVTERTVGGRQVIEVRTSWSRNDSDMGINEVESQTREGLMVCVRPAGGGVPTCPLDLVVATTYERDLLMDDLSPEEKAEMAPHQTPGLPIKSASKLSVELGDDGVARIRAVEGRFEPAQLGDRKLW